jgi:cold shock CspA family protein
VVHTQKGFQPDSGGKDVFVTSARWSAGLQGLHEVQKISYESQMSAPRTQRRT